MKKTDRYFVFFYVTQNFMDGTRYNRELFSGPKFPTIEEIDEQISANTEKNDSHFITGFNEFKSEADFKAFSGE